MARRVVITGMGFVTAFGDTWETFYKKLLQKDNAVKYIKDWEVFEGLNCHLAAPIDNFELPKEIYTRKKTRSMSRVSLLSTRATEYALKDAYLLDSSDLTDGTTGIAFGSCIGSSKAVREFASLWFDKSTFNIDATSYVRMMPHTTAVNTGLFFGVKGRVIPTSSACTSGSQAIGYAYESILSGAQDIMIAGGAEELCPSEVAAFDTLFATTQKNDTPNLTPSPFDKDRDGLVIGEGAGSLILEEYEHAKARGAKIYAEIIGFATNCDASHITQPCAETIEVCMRQALKNARLGSSDIAYISAHGTGTTRGDIAESTATYNIFKDKTPISSLKSYLGHTLGACGAIEAIVSVHMMTEGQFHPTINLHNVDERCGELDYIKDDFRKIDAEFIASNNFAFGGINTSIILKKL